MLDLYILYTICQGGPGSVFGCGLAAEWHEQLQFFYPEASSAKGLALYGCIGLRKRFCSGSGFGSWETAPAVPVRSCSGKPNKRKVGSRTFRGGKFEPKFDVHCACFPKERHPNSQKRMKFMNLSFGPFRLVCWGDSSSRGVRFCHTTSWESTLALGEGFSNLQGLYPLSNKELRPFFSLVSQQPANSPSAALNTVIAEKNRQNTGLGTWFREVTQRIFQGSFSFLSCKKKALQGQNNLGDVKSTLDLIG